MKNKVAILTFLMISASFFAMGCFSSGDKAGSGFNQAGVQSGSATPDTTIAGYITDNSATTAAALGAGAGDRAAAENGGPAKAGANDNMVVSAAQKNAAAPLRAIASSRRVTVVVDRKEYIMTTDQNGFFKVDLELKTAKTVILKFQRRDGSYVAGEYYVEAGRIHYFNTLYDTALGMLSSREIIALFDGVKHPETLKTMIGKAVASKQAEATGLSKITGRLVAKQQVSVPNPTGSQTNIVDTTEEPSAPVAGATVSLSGGGSTFTDANGYFSFTGSFTAGTYTVSAQKQGYSTKSATVTVYESNYGLASMDFVIATDSVFDSIKLGRETDSIWSGDTYDLTGIKTYAIYLDQTTAEVSPSWSADRGSISGKIFISDSSYKGPVMLTASYTEAKKTKTAVFTLSVLSRVESISLSRTADTIETGMNYDLSGITATARYTDGTTTEVRALSWNADAGSIKDNVYYPPANFVGAVNITGSYGEGSAMKSSILKLTIAAPGTAVVGPVLESFTPAIGTIGTVVKISGKGFGDTQGSSVLKFNGTIASNDDIVSWSNEAVIAKVPSGATSGYATLTTAVRTAAYYFDVVAIYSMSPSIISPGNRVTINGTGFGPTPEYGTVEFGGVKATDILKWSNSRIEVTCPAGIGSGILTVKAKDVTTNPVTYEISRLVSVSPAYGPPGSTVTLSGTGFGDTQGNNYVTFNGTMAVEISSWSNSTVMIKVPNAAVSGNISMFFGGAEGGSQPFRVTRVNSVTPAYGPAGTQVEIAGTGFGESQGSSFVSFSGITAGNISSWSDERIYAIVPQNAVSGGVSVSMGSIASPSANFTATSIASISPATGTLGTIVTISGQGFGAEKGSGAVFFNTVQSDNVTLWSNDRIIATVPPNALSGKISVKVNEITIDGPGFTVGTIISSLSVPMATHGMQLTITGKNFGSTIGTGIVKFGNVVATEIVSWSDEAIITKVPAGAVAGKVTVTANGIVSNGMDIAILSITSISPAGGTAGTRVTLTGSGFGPLQGSGFVSIGGLNATNIVSWSDSQIIFDVPTGVRTGAVKVSNGQLSATGNDFAVTTIDSLSTGFGPPGTQIVAKGSGFGSAPNPATIKFNGVDAAAISSWSDGEIIATVPAGATSGKVVVTTASTISNGMDFEVTSIDSATPVAGSAGTQIVINGKGFGTSRGTSHVMFNGMSTTSVVSWAMEKIIVAVPTGATSGNVSVVIGGISSNSATLTLISINSLSQTTGTVGAAISIFGTGFGNTQGTSEVKFGSLSAPIDFWSDSQIIARVPDNAISSNVTVATSGFVTNAVAFKVIAIYAISPAYGPPGTVVTVTGANFGDARGTSSMSFNGTPVSIFSFWSDTQVIAEIPAGATPGNAVINVNGFNTNGMGFSVTSINSLSQNYGPEGTLLTIGGTGFGPAQGGSLLKFNGTLATQITSWNDSTIVATVPAGATSGNVVVNVWGKDSSASAFSVTKLISLTPAYGPPGTAVTLNGTGFGVSQASSKVKFSGIEATEIVSWTDTVVTVKVPSTASTGNASILINSVSSNAMSYDVSSMSGVMPSFAQRNEEITITGTGFGAAPGANEVWLNGLACTINSWSNTQIKALVPATATPGYMKLKINGVFTNSRWFEVSLGYNAAATFGSIGNGGSNLNGPASIAVDSLGNIYVADKSNNRIQKIDPTGVFLGWIGRGSATTGWHIAASAETPMSGNGSGQFNSPSGVAVDTLDNVYVADTGNSRIQKFDRFGVFKTIFGSPGSGDGQFVSPAGIALDVSGNMFISDTNLHRVTVINSNGTFITKFGGFGTGNGQFASPSSVAVNAAGNIYVADTFNHRIQKFDASGTYMTKWGGFGSGDGQFASASGIGCDTAGNVYVADTNNNRIQKFDSEGAMIRNFGALGGMNQPSGVAIDANRNIYAADSGNNQAQKFIPQP